MVPMFTVEPLDGVGARLCPYDIATGRPQAFTVAFDRRHQPAKITSFTASSLYSGMNPDACFP
jgi:hypothetical protein